MLRRIPRGSAVEADWKNEKYLNPTAVQASYMAGDIAACLESERITYLRMGCKNENEFALRKSS